MEVPQKIKLRTPLGSSNPTSGYGCKGIRIRIVKRPIYTPKFTAVLLTVEMETPQVSFDECV